MDQTQVEALEQKHAHLEALIDEEEHRPHPDDIRLHELKKAKLRVKDEMGSSEISEAEAHRKRSESGGGWRRRAAR